MKLHEEFWSQPLDALGDEALQLIYAEVVQNLRDENPEADTLEQMLMERVAFLYVHIRNKEHKKLFAHDRAYKETMQLWVQMAADLRKMRIPAVAADGIREQILESVTLAIRVSMKALPVEVAESFEEGFLTELESRGL